MIPRSIQTNIIARTTNLETCTSAHSMQHLFQTWLMMTKILPPNCHMCQHTHAKMMLQAFHIAYPCVTCPEAGCTPLPWPECSQDPCPERRCWESTCGIHTCTNGTLVKQLTPPTNIQWWFIRSKRNQSFLHQHGEVSCFKNHEFDSQIQCLTQSLTKTRNDR